MRPCQNPSCRAGIHPSLPQLRVRAATHLTWIFPKEPLPSEPPSASLCRGFCEKPSESLLTRGAQCLRFSPDRPPLITLSRAKGKKQKQKTRNAVNLEQCWPQGAASVVF